MSERPYERMGVVSSNTRGGRAADHDVAAVLEQLVSDELAQVVEGAELVVDRGLWHELHAREPGSSRGCLLRIRLRQPGDDEVVARVLRAARQGVGISHPAVLPVHRFGCTDQLLWMTLQADAGERLGAWLESERAPSTGLAPEFLRLVSAPVLAMHRDGWVHGALTPEAFHRDLGGVWRICCPGVDVHVVRADLARGVETEALACCAPEVRAGASPSPASDQYSVAALFVRLLCGHFPGPTGELPRGTLPGEWASKLRRALALDPRSRLAGVGELLRALDPSVAAARASPPGGARGRSTRQAPGPFSTTACAPGGSGPQLLFFPHGGDTGGTELAPPGTVSRGRRVVGATVLIALSAVLASAHGGSPREIAAALSTTATKIEARWSRRGEPESGRPAPWSGERAAPPSVVDAGAGASAAARAGVARPGAKSDARPTPRAEPTAEGTEARIPSPSSGLDSGSSSVSPLARSTAPPAAPSVAPSSTLSTSARDTAKAPAPSPDAPARGDATVADPLPLAPGRLSLQSYPWASVFVDGAYVGTTPLLDLPVSAGPHLVRIERPDRLPYAVSVTVEPGQDLRLTGIVLDRRGR